MSSPRQVLPDQTYLVTRRCIFQLFLIVPAPLLVAALKYCLAEAATRYGIQIHAFCFLSNHYHLIVTDPHQMLPAFLAHFNRNAAWCINAWLHRKGCVWEPGSYNAVRLSESDGPLEKLAYVESNAVAAGLVSAASLWPGLHSLPEQLGTSETIKRPEFFFRKDGTMPEEVTLTLCPPPWKACPDMTLQEWREASARHLHEREETIRKDFQARGRTFLGVKKVLSTSPYDSPRSRESARQGTEKDGIRPRLAEHDVSLRRKALQLLKEFVNAYRKALKAFQQGVKDVVFPAGTYKMRVLFGVRCAPVPEFT